MTASPQERPERLRIGVFGGTFDPIHLGHLIIAAELQTAARLDRILFVPAGRPPHKLDQHLSNDADRLTMLELALANVPGFDVSTVDLDRDGPSFTKDTLRILSTEYPEADLSFMMGEDSLRDFLSWREPELIIAQAELAVATRPGVVYDLDSIYAALPEAIGRIHIHSVPEIGIASRDLRIRAANGKSLRFFVPDSVEQFIRDRGLYRAPVSVGR